jgi:hypothetical protein
VFLDGSALESSIRFSETVEGFANVVLEEVEPGASGDDNYLDGHGLFVQELTLTWRAGDLFLYGGKFNANFGRAWISIPGIFRKTLTAAYEFTENIGIGAGATVAGGLLSTHHLELAAYCADDTELGHSLFTDRGHVRRRDGGPGNTGGLDSFSLSIDGGRPGELPGLSYHVAYSELARGRGSPERQRGAVFSADYSQALGMNTALHVSMEVAHFSGWEGADARSIFLTPAMELRSGPWAGIAVWSTQYHTLEGMDDLVELSASYRFRNGLSAYLGWVRRDIGGDRDHEFGMRLLYRREF